MLQTAISKLKTIERNIFFEQKNIKYKKTPDNNEILWMMHDISKEIEKTIEILKKYEGEI